MNMSISGIKTWFGSLFIKRGGINPERDWKFIFIIALVAFCGTVAFDGYIFWQVQKGSLFNTQATATQNDKIVNEKALDIILEYYTARKMQFDVLRKQGVVIVDPSR